MKYIIFGAGKNALPLISQLEGQGHEIITITDNDPNKWGSFVGDYKVISPEQIPEVDGLTSKIIISVGSIRIYEEIATQLTERGFVAGRDFNKDLVSIIGDIPGRVSGEIELPSGFKACKSFDEASQLAIMQEEKRIFRMVFGGNEEKYLQVLESCKTTGLLGEWVVRTERIENEWKLPCALLLEHQYIEPITYSYEWTPKMFEQYVLYMNNLLHGDWGVSLHSGRNIGTEISRKFAVSAKLGGVAAIVAIIIGVILGSIAALTRNKLPDRLIVFFTTLGTAMPSFVLATLLLLVFCLKLGWVPVWSSSNPNYLLPIIALAAYPMAYITRLTKTSMLDALNQDYIRTARAKGVHRLKVIFKHALKNALIPVVTYVGPMVAYILTGSMVVENIFTIGGLGTEFVTSIVNRDYTMIMAITIFLAVLMVIANLLTDIAYKLIDPRITFE